MVCTCGSQSSLKPIPKSPRKDPSSPLVPSTCSNMLLPPSRSRPPFRRRWDWETMKVSSKPGEAPRPRGRNRLTYHLVKLFGLMNVGFFFRKSLWKWTCDASWGFIAVLGHCFPIVAVIYSCQIMISHLKMAVWYVLFQTKVYRSFS